MSTNYDTSYERNHQKRVHEELRNAGVSWLGLYKFTSRYVPRVIGLKEHIKAVVFGRQKEAEGFFGVIGGGLVATNARIIYIDHRPGYTTMDEISYGVVSGMNMVQAGPYASLTLYTKIGNYHLSFAKPDCVRRFAAYIDMRRLSEAEHYNLPSDSNFRQPHQVRP